jgi:CDP-diacylglycerol---glycerol-3-phosphate 3-phosphatidyltransferase
MDGVAVPTNPLLPLAVVVSIFAVLAAYAARTARSGRTYDPRVARVGGLFSAWTLEAFYVPLRWVGTCLARTGLSPDFWTVVSVLVTGLTLPLAAMGYFGLAGVALLLGSAFDAIDGVVARERQQASDAGAMLDSFSDRYADAAPLVGLALFYRGSAWQLGLVLSTLVGSLLVSYARARAEGLGLQLPSGMMRRHERIIAIAAALILGPLFATDALVARLGQGPVTFAIVAAVGVLSNVAAIKLMLAARGLLVAQGRGARAPARQAAAKQPEPRSAGLSEPRPTAAE